MQVQVDPDPPVVNEDVLHLEIRLGKCEYWGMRPRGRKRTCSASSLRSNSINAYCNESPVRLSRMTWQLMIVPKRENINSRSSSRVTGLSLHTKRTFSGGRTLANGRSPTISSVSADAAAAFSRRMRSSSSSGRVASGSSSSAMRVELSGGLVGEEGGWIFARAGGSGKGSSVSQNKLSWPIRGYYFATYRVRRRGECERL